MFDKVNSLRVTAGKSTKEWNERLYQQVAAQVNHIQSLDSFSWGGIWDRVKEAGIKNPSVTGMTFSACSWWTADRVSASLSKSMARKSQMDSLSEYVTVTAKGASGKIYAVTIFGNK